MASCKVGSVYIVHTALTKPPKAKFALCVCADPDYFFWINSDRRHHNNNQLPLVAGCHQLVRHDSYLDMARLVAHSAAELEEAKEFPCISKSLCTEITDEIERGLYVLPKRQADAILGNLAQLYP